MDKLISIIVPCYNVEKYIDRCFASLLAQTVGFERLEVIFVDDCSTDGTWARLTALESAYPDSVMIIHCDENGRAGGARNVGLQYATAPYIGYVDADDRIEPDMYEKLYDKLLRYDCDIAMCRMSRDYAWEEHRPAAPEAEGAQSRLLVIDTEEKRRTFLTCGSIGYCIVDKLYSRDFLLRNRLFFPEKLAYEDHFFMTLLYLYAERVYLLEETLYHYFVNPGSTVLTPDASYHFDILTVNRLLWDECANRGFLGQYRAEMEYQFLTLCYLTAMKMISLRMSHAPYDFFVTLKEETLRRVPDYHANPYVEEYVTELNRMLLRLLELPIGEADLNAVCGAVAAHYGKGILQIYVCTHVPFRVPEDPIYRPLQVGRALRPDLGYLRDDTGDNISRLNFLYSELTGLYWIWKNVRGAEYVGLCHYRRYFLTAEGHIMSRADFLPLLSRYDVIISQPVASDMSYREVYAQAHNAGDLEAVREAAVSLYPGCAPILEEVLAGHRLYCGNLFVTSKRLFDEYAAWLFDVFHEAEPKIHTEGYDDYHRRVYGFLSEQLVYVWIRYRGLSHYEAPIGFTQEKAETVELKERLAALFRERRIRQAGELFDETMRSRPDLTLPGSDFDRELTTISRILRDCLEAEKTGGPSPLDHSTDLNELIRRYREQPET